MKRQRGRGRKPTHSSNRSLESNGPEVKIRGSASQIYEKYIQYARDAQTAGDRVKAENLFQHAEHYYRIMQANMPKDRPVVLQNNREDDDDQYDDDSDDNENSEDQGSATVTGAILDDPMMVVDEVDASEGEAEESDSKEEEPAPIKRRPRRPRRKPTESSGNKPDVEARSALDALAEQQASIIGK